MRQKPLALAVTMLAVTSLICIECAPSSHSVRPGTVTKGPAGATPPGGKNQPGSVPPGNTPLPNQKCSTDIPTPMDLTTVQTNVTNLESNGGTAVKIGELPVGNYALTNLVSSYATPSDNPTYITEQTYGISVSDRNTKASSTCATNIIGGQIPASTSPQTRGMQAAVQPGQQQPQIQPDTIGRQFPIEVQFSVTAAANGAASLQSPVSIVDLLNRIGTGQKPDTEVMGPQANEKQGLIGLIQPNATQASNGGYVVANPGPGNQNQNEVYLSVSPQKNQLYVFYEFNEGSLNSVRRFFLTYSITAPGAAAPAAVEAP